MAIYTGGMAMAGRQGRDIRELSQEIEAQQEKYRKGMKKRKKWGFFGNILKTFLPGVGHLADLIIKQTAQKKIGIGSAKKIKGKETIWTGGQAKKYGQELRGLQKAAGQSFGEALLGSAVSFGAGKLGGEILGGATQKFGETGLGKWAAGLQQKSADWQRGLFAKTPQVSPPRYTPAVPSQVYNPEIMQYQQGGMVQGSEQQQSMQRAPTILEYFEMQGKTLGGSNKQSVSQMLGR